MTQPNPSSSSTWFVPQGHPCDSAELKALVEKRYSVKAEYIYTSPVRHVFGDVLWEGPVCVFAVFGHPTSTRAFAWSTFDGHEEQRHIALESRAVPEAAEAVRLVLSSRLR
jgi:hypothetical protein